LRDVLDLEGISFTPVKLDRNFLYTMLDKLESCQAWNAIAPLDLQEIEHLGLLVDYLKSAYADTTHNLLSLLSDNHITYDLLWALFKPNSLVYTTCSGTHKPRCVRYNFGEEKTTIGGAKHWSINCSYLEFNGEDMGSAVIELTISKFRGAKRINELEAFPLQYHAGGTGIRAELLRCGRMFMRLRGTHHCHCSGSAFYKQNGELVQVPIDGRIMVDAAFFRKMNPKNPQPRIFNDPAANWELLGSADDVSETSLGSFDSVSRATSFGLANELFIDQTQGSVADENLLICCPTVPGFSLQDKLWGKLCPP